MFYFSKRYFFKHPATQYLFILPAYLPIRSLDEQFPIYKELITNDFSRLYYFLFVLFQSAIAGILLSIMLKLMIKYKCINTENVLAHMRAYSLLIVVCFTWSTYILIYPVTPEQLYLMSGVHYFCISYLGNLIILETKHYNESRLKKTSSLNKALNSAAFGVNVDIMGMLSYFIIGFFISSHDIKYYGFFCCFMLVLFLLQLIFVRRYWQPVYRLFTSKSSVCYSLFYYLITISLCVSIAFIAFMTPYILIISFFGLFCVLKILKRTVSPISLLAIFTGASAYGVILVVLMTPIFIFSMQNAQSSINTYSYMMPYEPLISAIVITVILFFIVRGIIKPGVNNSSIFMFKSGIVTLLLPILLYFNGVTFNGFYVLLFFMLYSYIESSTQYGIREIIFNAKTDFISTLLNFYSSLTTRGVVSTLYLILIKCQSTETIHDSIFYTTLILSIFCVLSSLYGLLLSKNKNTK